MYTGSKEERDKLLTEAVEDVRRADIGKPPNSGCSSLPMAETAGWPKQESPEPLIQRLRREVEKNDIYTGRNRRAIDILKRHPEFEELLELILIFGF